MEGFEHDWDALLGWSDQGSQRVGSRAAAGAARSGEVRTGVARTQSSPLQDGRVGREGKRLGDIARERERQSGYAPLRSSSPRAMVSPPPSWRGSPSVGTSPKGRLSARAATLSERTRRKERLQRLLASKKFSPAPRSTSDPADVSEWQAAVGTQASGEQLAEGVPPSPHNPHPTRGRDFTRQTDVDATIAGVPSPSSVRMGAREFVAWLERDRVSSPTPRLGKRAGRAQALEAKTMGATVVRPRTTISAGTSGDCVNSEDDISEDEIWEMLSDMRLTELQQLAFTAGIPVEDVEAATYDANPQEALVVLLVRHSIAALRLAGRAENADEQPVYGSVSGEEAILDAEEQLLHAMDEDAAAIVVQRHVRGISARRAYAAQHTECDTARTIQSTGRNDRDKHARAGKLHDSRTAARTIQARYRGGRTRRMLDEEQRGALEIQRHWRGRQGRRDAEQARPLYRFSPSAGVAATSIQSRWRGGKSRENILPKMQQHRNKRNNAAAVVQARYRSSTARREAMEELLLRRIRRFKRHVDIGALVSLFEVNDVDNSATLSWKTFSEAIASGQVGGLPYAEGDEDEQAIASVTSRAVFEAADLDSDGYLDLEEFLQFLGLSHTTIAAWRQHGPSAGTLWLAGVVPPGWMTESWIRQGEDMTARRQLRGAKANTLRELRWPPSPNTLRRRQLHGQESDGVDVPRSPLGRAQELAVSRGAVSRLQAIDHSTGVGQIGSESSARSIGLSPRSPTKTRVLELAQRRGVVLRSQSNERGSPSPRSGRRELRGGALRARAEEMRTSPRRAVPRQSSERGSPSPRSGRREMAGIEVDAVRAEEMQTTPRSSRAQLIAQARAHNQATEPRTPRR